MAFLPSFRLFSGRALLRRQSTSSTSRQKMKAWIKPVKSPRSIIGTGARYRPARRKRMPRTSSSPNTFPKRRIDRLRILGYVPDQFNWQNERNEPPYGTRKMFDVLDPVELDPSTWVMTTTISAQASVVFRFAVGEANPGNHSQVIAAEDKKTEACDEWEHEAAFLTGNADHEILNARNHQFEEILSALREPS